MVVYKKKSSMISNIQIIAVCVDYLYYFQDTFPINREIFQNNLIVITDTDDLKTKNFCRTNSISCYETSAFYQNNSNFNKGAALNNLFINLYKQNSIRDWFLLLDTDIILDNIDIYQIIQQEEPKNTLYSASREIYLSYDDYLNKRQKSYEKCQGFGFFQLFHKSNIEEYLNNNQNIFFENKDASEYDIRFAYYNFKKIVCAGTVSHIGEIGKHWNGYKPIIGNRV